MSQITLVPLAFPLQQACEVTVSDGYLLQVLMDELICNQLGADW